MERRLVSISSAQNMVKYRSTSLGYTKKSIPIKRPDHTKLSLLIAESDATKNLSNTCDYVCTKVNLFYCIWSIFWYIFLSCSGPGHPAEVQCALLWGQAVWD